MASDLLFGWFLGLMTIILPKLLLDVYRLKRQLRFLTGPHEEKAEAIKKKGGWFNWSKKK